MFHINRSLLWIGAALLLAGVLTPLTLALPPGWQGPMALTAVAVVCLASTLVLARWK